MYVRCCQRWFWTTSVLCGRFSFLNDLSKVGFIHKLASSTRNNVVDNKRCIEYNFMFQEYHKSNKKNCLLEILYEVCFCYRQL